jgi:N6-adenosine-specific RNA methylase IME4
MALVLLGEFKHGGARRGNAKGLSRDQVGKIGNVSSRMLDRAAVVRGKGAKALQQAVVAGAVPVAVAAELAALPKGDQVELTKEGEAAILKVAGDIRRRKTEARRVAKVERLVTLAASTSPLALDRQFALAIADPPWRYERPLIGDTDRSIENKYPTMPLADICAMPVARYMLPAAMLCLFITAPQLLCRTPEGLTVADQICRAWGDPHWNDPTRRCEKLWFTPRAQLIWDKVDEDGSGRPGMGHYVRTQHEFLIIATRGAFPLPATAARPRSVFRQRAGEHSEKPDAIYELIRRMYPELIAAGLAVELFARAQNLHAGFIAWGNQAGTQLPDQRRAAA